MRRINQNQIVAAGHSVGGATVLLLAGSRLSEKDFQNPVPYCWPLPKEIDDEHCAEIKKHDFQQYPKRVIEQS
ncbi:MAG: hypothetical protein HQM16_15405 [Deltaproteobacteria bacterium]|nr:hypothetical protein [Deltaproteobacteria bacterium]